MRWEGGGIASTQLGGRCTNSVKLHGIARADIAALMISDIGGNILFVSEGEVCTYSPEGGAQTLSLSLQGVFIGVQNGLVDWTERGKKCRFQIDDGVA